MHLILILKTHQVGRDGALQLISEEMKSKYSWPAAAFPRMMEERGFPENWTDGAVHKYSNILIFITNILIFIQFIVRQNWEPGSHLFWANQGRRKNTKKILWTNWCDYWEIKSSNHVTHLFKIRTFNSFMPFKFNECHHQGCDLEAGKTMYPKVTTLISKKLKIMYIFQKIMY